MITLEKALSIVCKSVRPTSSETVSLTDSCGRVLTEDILSDTDMPPFNKSSVDGFACRREDISSELTIIETIAAGQIPALAVKEGQCSRIMTGAMVPEGADCVLMVEDVKYIDNDKIVFTSTFRKENIASKGEDVKSGDPVLKSGLRLKPQDIAILAAVGCTNVPVAVRPLIGVISTGSELVEPSEKPGLSKIRNSNAAQLMAQVDRAGAIPCYCGIAKDDEEETLRIVKESIEKFDVILLTGGVSMGDFDYVPAVLQKAGFNIHFSKIAVQPGKPTTFGTTDNKFVFGLPGNPVSSFVIFELLVSPFINLMMGNARDVALPSFAMGEKFSRKYTERSAFIPVRITSPDEVTPVSYHGSAHITALSSADGLVEVPAGKSELEKGERVSVRQI